ncbi:MAG: hypothetical protein DLM59_16585 [Pseudonocardiales bacterium]|nr:MAG: hypothetical protein DLM59_16585 [Pseudonocardiales bacterium]
MTVHLPSSAVRRDRGAVADPYGHVRLPASGQDETPARIDTIPYGRFRNVHLYITDYVRIIRAAKALGHGHVITTSNGLQPAARKFPQMAPEAFSYVQISLDGGSPQSHDRVQGAGR